MSFPQLRSKPLYIVFGTPPKTTLPKDLTYVVSTGVTPVNITKNLQYSVLKTYADSKSLKYTIKLATAPTKSLQYSVSNKTYSRGKEASPPTGVTNLGTLYEHSEYADVALDDGVRVNQSAGGQYALHLYKIRHTNNTSNISVSWNGQSKQAPSASTVYLQIYNYNSASWETLNSNNSANADTDFTLSGSKTSSVSNYYTGANNEVAVRVYQQGV